jgi:hypothetical protein
MTVATVNATELVGERRAELESQVHLLGQRLANGYAKIDEERANGRDATRWEDHWLELLYEYERVYDRLIA